MTINKLQDKLREEAPRFEQTYVSILSNLVIRNWAMMADFALQQIQAERQLIADRLDHVCICSDSSHIASELLKVQEELRDGR